MKYSYTRRLIFSDEMIRDLETATRLVDSFPGVVREQYVRCHEVARVVKSHVDSRWEVVDGTYFGIDHSWLQRSESFHVFILEVYAVGRLPEVQLVTFDSVLRNLLPAYKKGPERNDIREHVLQILRGFP